MLKEARLKANQSGLENQLSLAIGDMSRLPFPDDEFDVALSTYSMCPLRDPRLAAEELYRVVRPGGKIGVAHSTEPTRPITRKLAAVVEEVAWKIPQLSLGCRSIEVLPTFQKLGGKLISKWEIGVPLWPFLVFIVEKPSG
jgi:ubiquinone/menaquinone biosynthesis C-methylase UbiE